MSLSVMLRRCGELYREGGIRELSRGVRDYIEHDLGSDYQERRSDNQDRWEFISSHIDEDARSLIDIGCAEGEFAARAAEMELDVTGFDRNVTRLHTARTEHAEYSNLRFERAELTPETIDELPEADVILFLTVHHHWVKAYGWDEAANMFRTLLEKGETVIYEPPGHIGIKESTETGSLKPENSISYYTQILESDFGESARIVDVMLAEYKSDSDRADPIFVLDSGAN
ncbi:class I SAM-dependent methyltransferase [Halorubrum sp. DTA98]|uniref:class I SAM-dependent methyltransferase n=1 Tax=Halorubrum sp. DTA98 TaxID=3402163 RepID=UPI003AADFC3B